MDWILAISGFVLGGLTGYFVAKYVSNRQQVCNREMSEQEIKQLLAEQADAHIQASRDGLSDIEKQLQQMRNQLNDYESLLKQDQASNEQKGLSFFGDQASTYLRNQQGNNKRVKVKAQTQPLDFSGESTGLFDGTRNQQTVESK